VARGQASSVGVDGVHDVVDGSRVEQVVRRLGPGQRRPGGVGCTFMDMVELAIYGLPAP